MLSFTRDTKKGGGGGGRPSFLPDTVESCKCINFQDYVLNRETLTGVTNGNFSAYTSLLWVQNEVQWAELENHLLKLVTQIVTSINIETYSWATLLAIIVC